MMWEEIAESYFSNGIIPKGEYVFMALILGVCVLALWRARKMVSDI
ncbi:MAG: hypothetical protein FWG96_02835 [Methanomassiliicoccaceae archaeon]|nr:hypothetical protein [Methanomassiliicoccaceae archaeon]